jgi:hypothetical protein
MKTRWLATRVVNVIGGPGGSVEPYFLSNLKRLVLICWFAVRSMEMIKKAISWYILYRILALLLSLETNQGLDP